MAERKRWDKQQEFQPPRVDSSNATAESKADPVLTKQLQYIKVLEERNRVKKRLAAASKRNDRLQEREEAFVTAFNVPARAAPSNSSSLATRNTKSATSILPTKVALNREHSRLAKSKSAPSTTLNFVGPGEGDEKGVEHQRVRRAKWNRPQAPMNVAVEHQDGVPLFRLTTQSETKDGEQKDEDEDDYEEENYLEESFEEFEEEDQENENFPSASERASTRELVIEEVEEEVDSIATGSTSATCSAMEVPGSPSEFSRTTKELFGIIQHLSRSKQHALVDVLQKFQASEQVESDVKALQSSIGDPAIWKEIKSTLSPLPAVETAESISTKTSTMSTNAESISNDGSGSLECQERPLVEPLKHLLEEQLHWEDKYAHEVKERLEREREEKQRMMKEAAARRAKMMKQLEDEEREIERLMEIKRQERLAKLRALQEEVTAADIVAVKTGNAAKNVSNAEAHWDKQAIPMVSLEVELKDRPNDQTHDFSEVDEQLYFADAKDTSVASLTEKGSDVSSSQAQTCAKSNEDLSPVVPPLKLPTTANMDTNTGSEQVKIHMKLLSAWSKTRAVGLTQICVYDLNGEELSVDIENVRLYDHVNGRPLPKTNEMVRGLKRLFNGVAHTNDEKDMWLGRLGDSGVLLIGFKVSLAPSKLCIWNYNSKAHAVCTRDIEVLVNGKCVWTGSLPETFGDQDDNICAWVDLLGSARKTARTARQPDYSTMPVDKVEEKLSRSLQLEQKFNSEAPRSNPEKPNGGTPVWLSTPSSSSTTAEISLGASRSNVDLDAWTADEKQLSGSTTSRRRQGKALFSSRSEEDASAQNFDFDRADVKPRIDQDIGEEKERQQKKVTAPALASLSSWDSLEKFSKTTRSRLPQPTDLEEGQDYEIDSGAENVKAKPQKNESRTFTTSALLVELRQGILGPSASIPDTPPSTYRSSSVAPLPGVESTSNGETGISSADVIQASAIADIPVLPRGRWLQVEILSTWGDHHYVGLNGIEIFDDCGELVTYQDPVKQVTACPESINVLEENTDDPRIPKNLVDGVNFTCDDFHMWLAPFTQGQQHYVLLEMDTHVAISMVRIWNYNKSRTHTCRGAREARLILFDALPEKLSPGKSSKLSGPNTIGNVIFEGEIRQAPGLVGADSMEISNEVLLFTQDTAILQAIETNDEALRALAREQEREDEETHAIMATVQRSMELQRPRTSDAGSRTIENSPKNQESDDEEQRQSRFGKDGRPMTMATRSSPRLRASVDSWVAEEPQQRSPDAAKVSEGTSGNKSLGDNSYVELNSEESFLRGRRLTLRLQSSWGDRNYVGLTQIEVLVGSRGTPIPLDVSNVDATPRDLASLGYVGDPRTLDKLFDGEGTTCDDTHMWLVPLQSGAVPEVRIEFKMAQYFYGLRIWNYNKSPEDTYRGVKQLVVALDNTVISPEETGFLLRKAPGVAEFNFAQLLRFPLAVEPPGVLNSLSSSAYAERARYPFSIHAYKTPIIRQDYEAPLYPQGFILKIVCWATWGDPYYLGLNGLELYDFSGARITEKPTIITAAPYSVTELDNGGGRQQDVRTPENLMSGFNKNTWEAHDAWLAPLASSLGNQQGNIIYVGFDSPVVLSMIKFWNYAKSPERGVKDIDIYLDNLHIFSGTLRKAPAADTHGSNSQFSRVHKVAEQFGQPVLFSCSQAQVDAEKRSVYYCGTEEQDVLGINDGQVMQESRSMYRKPDPGAEGVVVDLDCRPMTAVCRQ